MSEEKLAKPDIGDAPLFPVHKFELSDWKDGIVIRSPNWLGDAVMTLPALLQLKKMVPRNCGLFVVCPPHLLDFFRSIPIVDFTINLHSAHKLWKLCEIDKVRRLHAGIAVLFNNSLRDTIYFRLTGIPRIFGASARGRDIMLTKSFKFPESRKSELNKLHHASKYLAVAYALGAAKWDGELPEFRVQKEPELMDASFVKISSMPRLMTIAAGAAYGESKRWPAEFFNRTAGFWAENGGNIAVLGSPKEKEIGDKVIEGLPSGKAYNLAGKTDISELIQILKKSEICVANDSGIMHLSAAVGGRGIAIFGSTDPSATSPVSAKWKVLFEKEYCAPCFKRECLKKVSPYTCLKKITPSKVISAIEDLLKK
ncbi:MAG: lipopolysaccharide heptosyltransferase II [Lentisphaerae bacterium GWF2_44_16]|nr:MAG: lipopolysaccharide heptosyltransferase II [Lentisphaerae bacterium GWF2_44_16]